MVLTETFGNYCLDALDALINAGLGAGDIQFATSNAFTTILATPTLNDPAFGAASGKSMSLDVDPAIHATVAAGGGTAAYGRFRDSDGTVAGGYFTVGATGSGMEMIFSTVVWAENAEIYIDNLAVTA